jgi:hypothetical protein
VIIDGQPGLPSDIEAAADPSTLIRRIACPLPHEGTDAADCPPGFREERHECVPDMRHARPYFELDLTGCSSHALGHAHGIVAQDLVAADLDQGRRQPGRIAIERRGVGGTRRDNR